MQHVAHINSPYQGANGFSSRLLSKYPPDIVLFDWDRTLFDNQHFTNWASRTFIELNFADPKPDPKDTSKLWRENQQLYCETYFPPKTADDPGKTPADILAMWDPILREISPENMRLLPGAMETIAFLAKKSVRMGIASSKPDDMLKAEVEFFGITRHFDIISGHKEGRKLKPDPSPLIDPLKELGIPLGNAWYAGDDLNDYLAARSAGFLMHVIGEAHAARIKERNDREDPKRMVYYHNTLGHFLQHLQPRIETTLSMPL